MKKSKLSAAFNSSLILVSLFMFACTKDTAADIDEESKNKITASGNPALQNATYAAPCGTSNLAHIGSIPLLASQTYVEMGSLNFNKRQVYFTDADCKTMAFQIQERGRIHVAGKSAVVANALDEDFNYESITLMVHDELVMNAFNQVSLCGINNWTKGTERDLGVQASVGICPGQVSHRKTIEIVLVENNQLYFGADDNPDNAHKRPTQVNRSRPFSKK